MTVPVDALRNAIGVKAHGSCPMCGQDRWVGGERLVALAEAGATAGVPALEALPFVCTSCGYVRLHAVQPLETIDD